MTSKEVYKVKLTYSNLLSGSKSLKNQKENMA